MVFCRLIEKKRCWSIFVQIVFLMICIFCFFSGVCDAKNAIKIGVIGPMKFPAGEHMFYGAEMAADEINSIGGVNLNGENYDIELIKTDSNEYLSIPDAVSSFEKLVSVNKVDFIVGGGRSEAILAQMELMGENKIIYIMAGGGSPKLCEQVAKDYDKHKYFFRFSTPNSANQVKTVSTLLDLSGKEIRKQLGIEKPKVALLMEKAVWADAMVNVGNNIIPKLGMEIVGVWRPSPKANDLTSELTSIKDSGAHIIFHVFSGPAGIVFGKQWGELQIPAAPVGVNIESQQQKYWETTDGMCEYEAEMNAIVRADVTSKTVSFFDNYYKKTGEWPFYSTMGPYDAVYFLKEAIEKVATLDSDTIVAELEKSKYEGVAGTIAFYPKDHKWPHDLIYGPNYSTCFGVQWIDGKHVAIWPNGKIKPLGELGDWENYKLKGVAEYQLPPFMLEYWKKK